MHQDRTEHDALLEKLRDECRRLPDSEEYVMVHHPAFRVGKKPFVIVGLSRAPDSRPTLSVNLGHAMQGELLDDPRFSRTPYIGQHGWVTVCDADLSPRERERLLTESWQRIAGKKRIAAWSAQRESTRR